MNEKQSLKRQISVGRKPVLDLLKSDRPIEKVYMDQRMTGDFEKELRQLCRQKGIPLVRTDIHQLNKLASSRNHQGICCFTSPIEFIELEDLVPYVYESGKTPLFLLLDQISDVGNFGAIIRSAEVLGADGVIIGKKGASALNDHAVKASAGALFEIPICRVKHVETALNFLKQSGIKVMASVLGADKKIIDCDFTEPSVLIIGSEGFGVSKAIQRQCDEHFEIPQYGKTDSLNVSVATGIMLYEVMRQRNNIVE